MNHRLLYPSLIAAALAMPAAAHEVRPAFLELCQTSAEEFEVGWKVPARGERLRLALRVRLPEDCTQATPKRSTFTGEAYIDRWRIRHLGALVGERISVDGLDTTMTDVMVRIEHLDGTIQIERLVPTSASLVVKGTPTAWQAALTYLVVGIRHILGGIDHLLFVLGLLFLVRGGWMLVKTITSFTIAHSITLAVATLGFAEAPVRLLNVLIAMSILFLGPELIRLCRGRTSLTIRHPWLVAFLFGLLHGFGFASGLTELGLPSSEIPLALLMFNVGVECGQLAFVFVLLGLAASLAILECRWRSWMRQVPGYVIGSLGAYWMIGQTVLLFSR